MKGLSGIRLRVPNFFEKDDCAAARAFLDDLHALFAQDGQPQLAKVSPCLLFQRSKLISWFLAGFVVLCDWIGSNASWFQFRVAPIPLDEYWKKHAIPQAEEALSKAGIGRLWKAGGSPFCETFPWITNPSPLQRFVEICAISKGP